MKSVAEKFWNEEGWHIEPKKKPFLHMVNEAFWDIVLTQVLKPYHGSVAGSFGGSLDEGEGIRDGNDNANTAMAAACVTEKSEKSGVAHAEQEDDLVLAAPPHDTVALCHSHLDTTDTKPH